MTDPRVQGVVSMDEREGCTTTATGHMARRSPSDEGLASAFDSTPVAETVPPVGARVRVYWPAEECWFTGDVDRIVTQDGAFIFHVSYDDGDEAWYNGDRVWEQLPTSTASPTEVEGWSLRCICMQIRTCKSATCFGMRTA